MMNIPKQGYGWDKRREMFLTLHILGFGMNRKVRD